MVAAVGKHPANKSNISILVDCYDLANLRQVLIPLANGNTIGVHRHQDCSRSGVWHGLVDILAHPASVEDSRQTRQHKGGQFLHRKTLLRLV